MLALTVNESAPGDQKYSLKFSPLSPQKSDVDILRRRNLHCKCRLVLVEKRDAHTRLSNKAFYALKRNLT